MSWDDLGVMSLSDHSMLDVEARRGNQEFKVVLTIMASSRPAGATGYFVSKTERKQTKPANTKKKKRFCQLENNLCYSREKG